MPLPRPASPRALWADLRAFWATRPRHQWVAGVLAVLIPIGIVAGFFFDGRTRLVPKEQVITIYAWPSNRTDAEIRAKAKADQIEREAARRQRQREFQKLDASLNRMGI